MFISKEMFLVLIFQRAAAAVTLNFVARNRNQGSHSSCSSVTTSYNIHIYDCTYDIVNVVKHYEYDGLQK